jgi:hypothetical protein
MSDTQVEVPEFHIVVKRPGRGPLAPFRFAVVIAFAFAIAGGDLYDAAQTGVGVDDALIRAGVAGVFAWFVLGMVNSILKHATARPGTPSS